MERDREEQTGRRRRRWRERGRHTETAVELAGEKKKCCRGNVLLVLMRSRW